MKVPQKTKYKLPYDPAIPLLGIYLKKKQKGTCNTMFTPALLTIAKIYKQLKYPLTDE